MDLWTEYEGKTIDGDFYLQSLLRSEGRSAFFRTHGSAKQDEVIRLTEAHFDEAETLKRWRQIAAVEQGNLIEIRRVGQTTIDGVALTYALLEPSDAALAEVLRERPLTATETVEVARAVVSALSALHGNGLVHEHIGPENVLAVGETVKLRSDCVRECVVDMEFSTAADCEELRRRDLHDLGVLLLQCLTLQKEWKPGLNLAKPFQQLIPGALNGGWTLPQMAAALDSPPTPQRRPIEASPDPAARPSTATAGNPVAGSPAASGPAAIGTVAASGPESRRSLVPEAVLQTSSVPLAAPRGDDRQDALGDRFRPRNQAGLPEHALSPRKAWLPVAAGLLAVVLLGWFLFGRASKPAPAGVQPASVPADAQPVAVQRTAAGPRAAVAGPAAPKAAWHVIAFTYHREDQARAKAVRIAKKHASLQPAVFSPSGHAPFFVALGGAMTSTEASSLLRRARQSGMPRDTFIRNY